MLQHVGSDKLRGLKSNECFFEVIDVSFVRYKKGEPSGTVGD